MRFKCIVKIPRNSTRVHRNLSIKISYPFATLL